MSAVESAGATVVICTRDRPALLDRCLEAVERLDYDRFDVLVIDNAPSSTQTQEVAARRGVHYIVEPVAGLSRARNRGARASGGEIVAFLDDDAIPEPGWLSSLAQEFSDPCVMAVTGRIVGLCAEAGAALGLNTTDASDQWKRRLIDRRTAFWFELANFGGIGDGGNMAFRRRAFDMWPGFDERIGRGMPLEGGEEHHAFFSLLDRGHSIVYTPNAIVHHPYPRTSADRQARRLKDLAAATGYFTLLLAEYPRYRWAVAKYLFGAIRGTPRPWRKQAAGPLPVSIPWWCSMVACLHGPMLYAHTPRVTSRKQSSAIGQIIPQYPASVSRNRSTIAPANVFRTLPDD